MPPFRRKLGDLRPGAPVRAVVVLASGATRIDTALRVVHVPRILTDGTAAWFGELEEITEGGPTGDELILTPKKCATLSEFRPK